MVIQVGQEIQDHRVSQEHQALKALREIQDLKDLQDLLGNQDLRVLQGTGDCQGFLAPPDSVGQEASEELLVTLDHQASLEVKGPQDLRV